MRKDTLDMVVALHKQWLQSSGVEGQRANLESADLRQADLRNVDLSYATLAGANFERAELSGAFLCNADLREANLGYASLVGSYLNGANLQQAVAIGVNLSGAHLIDAILIGVRMDHALLKGANLSGALAHKGQFYRCCMTEAILDCVDFTGANLTHANLTSASVLGASFQEVELKGAMFTSKQGHSLAVAQRLQNLSDDDLSQEEKQIHSARRRFLRNVLLIQKSTLWIGIIGFVITIFFGAYDLYAMAITRKFSLSSDFNYILALIVTLGFGLTSTLAAFFRLRTLEGARTNYNCNQKNSPAVTNVELPSGNIQNSVTQMNETDK